jgi:Rad9
MYGLEATMPQYGMKSFTKALACLARYGDELSIVASPADLSLSVTNSSKSAYARIKFYSGFFDRYSVTPQDSHLVATKTDPPAAEGSGAAAAADESPVAVRGEILVKVKSSRVGNPTRTVFFWFAGDLI